MEIQKGATASRRAILGGAILAGAMTLAGASVASVRKPDEWDEFTKCGQWVFPGIASAVAEARAAGYHPDDVYCIVRPRPGSGAVLCSRPGEAPATFDFAITKPERVAA